MVVRKFGSMVTSRVLPKSVRRKLALKELNVLRKSPWFKSRRKSDFENRLEDLRDVNVYGDALSSANHGVKRRADLDLNYDFIDKMMKGSKPFYEGEYNKRNNASKDRMGTRTDRLRIAKKWRLRKKFPKHV